jgi:hypothetical protein
MRAMVVVAIILMTVTVVSQEHSHKCPEVPGKGRIILETEEALNYHPKVLQKEMPKVKGLELCTGNDPRISVEMLIDEEGKVECVEVLKAPDMKCKLVEVVIAALQKWRFTQLANEKGQKMAYYWHMVWWPEYK